MYCKVCKAMIYCCPWKNGKGFVNLLDFCSDDFPMDPLLANFFLRSRALKVFLMIAGCQIWHDLSKSIFFLNIFHFFKLILRQISEMTQLLLFCFPLSLKKFHRVILGFRKIIINMILSRYNRSNNYFWSFGISVVSIGCQIYWKIDKNCTF